jgi:hypothetical protein
MWVVLIVGHNPRLTDCDCPKKILTGELDLRRSRDRDLGIGNHAKVILAPLMIPSTPPVHGAVAVKYGHEGRWSSESMLRHEAYIYEGFPRHLHCDDTPVVPKFYGFYEPSRELDDNCKDCHDFDGKLSTSVYGRMPALLLLEPCGKTVSDYSLSDTDR